MLSIIVDNFAVDFIGKQNQIVFASHLDYVIENRSTIYSTRGIVGIDNNNPTGMGCDFAFNILNIRKGRSTPGLRAQHLAGIQLICELTGSTLKGGDIGSEEINIVAGGQQKEEVDLHIPTAGSLSLIYQLLSNYAHDR